MSDIKTAKKIYASSQDVKWCSGCGDYSVLKQTQLALAQLELPKEDVVFVSGIGCSSRFPYYLDTYGYHTLHGRAMAVATGVKCQNPDLSVWVAIGDGDAISIGGNHFIHAAKRNLDMVVILMDNRIYGLTKGQVSPTSEKGKVTKTTPYGSIDEPMDPVSVALGAGASFVARTTDRNQALLLSLLKQAHQHKGFALVHVLQNCLIFNDATFERYTGKEKEDNSLMLQHGEPMIFGKEKDKALVLDNLKPKVVKVTDIDPEQILKHDAHDIDSILPGMLVSLHHDVFPMSFGVIRQVELPVYDADLREQVKHVSTQLGYGDLQQLLTGNSTWTID